MNPQLSHQQALSRERDRRKLLLEVNNAVVQNLSLRDLLVAVSGWLHKFINHDFASVVLVDEASGQLREGLKNKLVSEKLYLEEEIQTEYNFDEIIGQSVALKKVLQVATVAPTDSVVLPCGETGTGKELIARAIHNRSGRRS